MKKIHYFLLVVCLWIVLPACAEKYRPDQLNLIKSQVRKTRNTLQMEFVLDYNQLSIPSNDQLVVSPVVIGQQDTLNLPYLLFPGKTRDKVNRRKVRLYGNETFSKPYATLYSSEKDDTNFIYRIEIPFESWMYGARIELQQNIYGCADCHRIMTTIPINYIANPPRVAFIVPPADSIREERIMLYVNFPWDQAVILPRFRDNATELSKIERSMQKIISEQKGKLQRLNLTGYASPEGSYTYNTQLAGQRVQAVKNYIIRKYPETKNILVTDTIPEDWQGVMNWTNHSDLKYKTQVLDIIDNISDPDTRDSRIRQLDGSHTYHRLLQEAYPQLRRVEYRVNYKVQPLTVSQCREIYGTHPERLTLYELYFLADSYPENSPEFHEIILYTAQLYPQDIIANNNAAAIALKQEDPAKAHEYLLKCSDTPQSLNNQGVLLLIEDKIPEACEYFRNAGNRGCDEAIYNLSNLEPVHPIP